MAWITRFLTAVASWLSALSDQMDGTKSPNLSSFIKLAHLLSFSTAWGAALWVTFISSSVKNLPRHQFDVPGFFSMVGFVVPYRWRHLSATMPEKYQLGFLVSAFVFNLSNLFVFTPMTIEMMKQRHKVEREADIGDEIGWSKNQEAAKTNPKLAAMNKKFGMIHGLSSLANIMSFGSLAMHSWFLAGTARSRALAWVGPKSVTTLATAKSITKKYKEMQVAAASEFELKSSKQIRCLLPQIE
ncbi:hypothetical protein CXB51_030465 [Gossypium anomalum]|uniref:DUF4149 domain-containing protein n=1 Tax=Gossypium anomalum TaxID=47600 RepID=A0A8J5Y5U9_9ROSI|nr:hypothetical protein CXB51_030465 [Gossypium anomalum]